MSSARLRGVWCADCWKRGHRCQAQIVAQRVNESASEQDGEEVIQCVPLCMRCADGELCCFETAKALPAIKRLDEGVDLPIGVMPVVTESRMENSRRVAATLATPAAVKQLRGEMLDLNRSRTRYQQRKRREERLKRAALGPAGAASVLIERPPAREALKAVSMHFGVRDGELKGSSKLRNLVVATLCRVNVTQVSIGRMLEISQGRVGQIARDYGSLPEVGEAAAKLCVCPQNR